MDSYRKIRFIFGSDGIRRFRILFFLDLFVASLEALGIGSVFPIIAAISAPNVFDGSPLYGIVSARLGVQSPAALVPYLTVLLCSIFLVKNLIFLLSIHGQGRIIHEQRVLLSRRLFEHCMNLDYDRFTRKKVADLMYACTGQVNNFVQIYCVAGLKIVSESCVVVATVSMLLFISATATLSAILAILVAGGIYHAATRAFLEQRGKEGREAYLSFYHVMYEGIGGMKEVKIFNAEDFFLNRYDEHSARYRATMVVLHTMQSLPRVMLEVILLLSISGTILYLEHHDGALAQSMPLLAVFGLSCMRLLPSFRNILTSLSTLGTHQVDVDALHAELSGQPVGAERRSLEITARTVGTGRAFKAFTDRLEVKDLWYTYPGNDTPALTNVSLSLSKGQSIALVGKSGAGKTTLVDVLLGLLQPQSGSIVLDGKNVFDELHGWRDLIGYIPQDIFLMNASVVDNIVFGVKRDAIDTRALDHAVEVSQVGEFVGRLPDGMQTIVGDRGAKLSGGQKQRIGIARALYRNPEILIMDEATSSLDNETEAEIAKAMERLSKEKTLIIIAHRLSTIKNCDKLYLIEDGRITAEGSYEQLERDSEWFARVSRLA